MVGVLLDAISLQAKCSVSFQLWDQPKWGPNRSGRDQLRLIGCSLNLDPQCFDHNQRPLESREPYFTV
jgi:hypothetical protein